MKAQARATPYMNIKKINLLMNSFFITQFKYCPLIWMLHSRCNNNKIKHLHKRCLRLMYCDKASSYEELLEKDGSVSLHHRSIRSLAIEVYEVKNYFQLLQLTFLVQCLKTIIISEAIMILGFLLQK